MYYKICSALAGLLMLSTVSHASYYRVVDLGDLGGSNAVAYKINNSGMAVGHSQGPANSFDFHPALYDGTAIVDLGTLDFDEGDAYSINDSMVAVGASSTSESGAVPVVYSNGQVLALPEHATLNLHIAVDINNNGIVIGSGFLKELNGQENFEQFFAYDLNSSQYISLDEQTQVLTASAINDSNVLVGYRDHLLSDNEGDFTTRSYVVDLDNLENTREIPSLELELMQAKDININNEVVGYIRDRETGLYTGFYYNFNADQVTLLESSVDSFPELLPTAINDLGQIVGYATNDDFESIPFIIDNSMMKNINELICDPSWSVGRVLDINNSGEMVVYGGKDGAVRALKLIPVADETSCKPTEEVENEEVTDSGGGSVPFLMLVLLTLFGFRRKFN
ncbi:DUF3466 family protein [Kangiella sp. M94]